MVIRDVIRDCYAARWGTPHRVGRFDAGGRAMEIYKWPESATGEGVAIYATNGASAEAVQPSGYRVEFFIGLTPEFDDIAPALSLLGSYPSTGNAVFAGDTVTHGEPLWRGAAARTFLVVPQTEALLEALLLPDATHVHFHMVMPISDGELALTKKRGAEWLLGELNDRSIPTWKHDRRCLA